MTRRRRDDPATTNTLAKKCPRSRFSVWPHWRTGYTDAGSPGRRERRPNDRNHFKRVGYTIAAARTCVAFSLFTSGKGRGQKQQQALGNNQKTTGHSPLAGAMHPQRGKATEISSRSHKNMVNDTHKWRESTTPSHTSQMPGDS